MKTTAIHRYLIAFTPAAAPATEGTPQLSGVIMLPEGAVVRSVGVSSKGLAIFAQVDPAAEPTELRTFRLVRTGEQLEEASGNYIGTIAPPGAPALHVFEML